MCADGGRRPGEVPDLNEVLDLRRILRTARRRWATLLALVAIGAGCGAVMMFVQTPTYRAESLVLLPPSPLDAQGKPVRSIQTQARVALSTEILTRVGASYSPPVSPKVLRKRVHTRGVSDDIVEVGAEAGSASDARILADAVANEYVAFSNGIRSEQADSTVGVLEAQAAALQARIRQLEADIAAGTARLAIVDQRSTEGMRQAALIDAMRYEQVDASRQLASVNSRVADARLDAELNTRGTRVLQPAETPTRPVRPRPVLDIGAGVLIGLLAGAVLVVALDTNDGRVRRRNDVAEAIGAPVLASIAAPTRAAAATYRDLLDAWQPDVLETLALRQAFTGLGVADEPPPANLVAVMLPGDRVAPMAAVKLALFAAAVGTPTALVLASRDGAVRDLRTALATRRNRSVRPKLSLHDMTDQVEPPQVAHTELTVTIVVADGAGLLIPTFDRRTLTAFVVSSGFAFPEDLASTALACADSGFPIRGAFVVNPDPGDRTSGIVQAALAPTLTGRRPTATVHELTRRHTREEGAGGDATGAVGREAAP